MNSDSSRIGNLIHVIVEAAVAVGFAIGLIPFGYLLSSHWVVPLTIISAVLALVLRNGTLGFSAVNIALAFLSWIPVIGYLPRIVGIALSLLNIARIRRFR